MLLNRRGFTLIELLVVIAIIAILAAILFPVFAQAKLAAKGAASLSNAKQVTLGILMYSNDSDDTSPPATAWNTGDAQLCFGTDSCFAPWSYISVPYIKSGDIFQDPLPGGDNGYTKYSGWGLSQAIWKEYFTGFGYDAALLNTQVNANDQTYWVGNSMTSFSRPADFVMLTESVLLTDPGYYPFYAYSRIMNYDTVEGPYCYNGCSDLWYGQWFTNPSGYGYGGATQFNDGANTGGVAWRRGGTSNTAFIDGHVKSMTAGALAAGTNWRSDISYGEIELTDKDKFHWFQY